MRQLKPSQYHIHQHGQDFYLRYRDKTGVHVVEIQAGGRTSFELEVFREKGCTYALSWDKDVPFVGIEKFLGGKPKGNLYLYAFTALEEVFGNNPLRVSPLSMARRLAAYFSDTEESHGG
jgi:hypothetical protein